MKRLTVCFVLAAFAMVSSLQAGEKSEKGKAASAAKEGSSCSVSTAASCSAKTAGCAISAKAKHAMKGATLLARR